MGTTLTVGEIIFLFIGAVFCTCVMSQLLLGWANCFKWYDDEEDE